ncbi:GNAT family N-acetyltransferase [Phenylobacterium sp.]|jgi:CelD/BcsL family acetyltransferase involved in cellulose biosynthesis|uniref:GNAT family N-acetyltransferase n=1 Tax=Phenylobacterium sp. TaxID=1871053 RepID=UPI002E3330EA|nr:GNAT family N-acetyltransferase [Phenylobacterium sp.]HEX2559054.1 GNAT family N-acetyltransferase [Phenylobacterium sp.]
MIEAATFHPAELSSDDAAAWRGIQAARPEFDSPLLGPEFAQAVGGVREDARVTVWRSRGEPVAFLAYHRRPGRLARPIGAPLSDYHALIAERPFDLPAGLAAADLGAYRFTGLLDPCQAVDGFAGSAHPSYVIRLMGTPEDYLEQLRARSAKRFKNYRRLTHKLEREVGRIKMVAGDRDPAALQKLIDWKRSQLARTGGDDFLSPQWTKCLVQRLFEQTSPAFGGLMVNLYVDGRLAAGHFGVRAGGVFHPWIASTNPDLAPWSPGQVFLMQAITAMPSAGLSAYDLGPGHDHYKAPFALAGRTLLSGCATAAGPAGRGARAAEGLLSVLQANSSGVPGRLRRRLDNIAALELSLEGRVRGLAGAMFARAAGRSASREAA